MKIHREIHSLDYAICVLVSLLDHVFRGRCDWWNTSRGLNVEILDRRGDSSKDVLVHIRPVGWRQDEVIAVRCMTSYSGGWRPFKGSVHSPRLPSDLSSSFNFETNWPYTLEGRGTREDRFLKEVCPSWFKTA